MVLRSKTSTFALSSFNRRGSKQANLEFRKAKTSASGGLTHAGDLTLPTRGAAPRNGRLLWGIRAAAADDDASSQEEKRENGFLERGHGLPHQYRQITFLQDPSQRVGQHLSHREVSADVADEKRRHLRVSLVDAELLAKLGASGRTKIEHDKCAFRADGEHGRAAGPAGK